MTPATTLEQFKSWIDYAKAHNYWLVIVYHEVVPNSAPRCTGLDTDPDVCLADFDTTVADFQAQLDYISSAGLGPDVVTVSRLWTRPTPRCTGRWPYGEDHPGGSDHERHRDGGPDRVRRPRR